MSTTDFLYVALTALVSLISIVVAVRLLLRTVHCRARNRRLAMMLGGVTMLLGLSVAMTFDAFDNVVSHANLPIIPSTWLSCVSAAITALWFEIFGRYVVERVGFERRLEDLATTDPLTGILNRRAYVERGGALVDAARRFNHPLAVMMVDIDHFKRINDSCGHDAGDDVLRMVVSVVKGCLRQVDIFGRLGGEEFSVLMPETAADGVLAAAERIRAAVEQAELLRPGGSLSVTVSIGATAGPATGGDCLQIFLKRADEALYGAKHGGRNCVVLADSGVLSPL